MRIHNVLAEDVKSVNGICLTVENGVGGVKVYADISRADSLDSAKQGNGSLLSCFKEEILSLFLHVSTEVAECGYSSVELCRARILGDKANVSNHLLYTDLLGKIRCALKLSQTSKSVGYGNEAYGVGTCGEIPLARTCPACPERRNVDAGLGDSRLDLLGVLVALKDIYVPDAYLAGVDAKLLVFTELFKYINVGVISDHCAYSVAHISLLY